MTNNENWKDPCGITNYKDGKGGRGDLVAEIKVMVPKKLSLEERNLFENLNKISTFNPRNN